MALNLKTLATRSASAAVFVVLLVGCVYWSYISFSVFFFIVSLIGLNEFYKIAEKMGAKPSKAIGFILGALVYLSFINPKGSSFLYYLDSFTFFKDVQWFSKTLLIVGPFIILAVSLFSKREGSIKNGLFTLGGIVYSIIPFALLNQTVCFSTSSEIIFAPKLILGIIFLIWSNDTFAYIGGSIFGKHKMIERVSPGKTWEGTIIGVLLTFALSFTFEHFCKLNIPWAVFGITIPILATIGDLVESKLKRESGIKDSGNIMPGHGGVLDRFDSLIFVSPFVFAILYFIS